MTQKKLGSAKPRSLFSDINQGSLLLTGQWPPVSFCAVTTEHNEGEISGQESLLKMSDQLGLDGEGAADLC